MVAESIKLHHVCNGFRSTAVQMAHAGAYQLAGLAWMQWVAMGSVSMHARCSSPLWRHLEHIAPAGEGSSL